MNTEFFTALITAQKAIKHAIDNKTNTHLKSSYASFEALHEAVVPVMNGQGILVRQVSHECENAVSIETILSFEKETASSGLTTIPVSGTTPHAWGSTLTYARKSSLALAANIGHQTDDDANSALPKEKKEGMEINHDFLTANVKQITLKHFGEKRRETDPEAKIPQSVDDLTIEECEIASAALKSRK